MNLEATKIFVERMASKENVWLYSRRSLIKYTNILIQRTEASLSTLKGQQFQRVLLAAIFGCVLGYLLYYRLDADLQEQPMHTTQSECVICGVNKSRIIFVPCKHLLSCDFCARRVGSCPVCRIPISEKLPLNEFLERIEY